MRETEGERGEGRVRGAAGMQGGVCWLQGPGQLLGGPFLRPQPCPLDYLLGKHTSLCAHMDLLSYGM